jgi:hypothetical protein
MDEQKLLETLRKVEALYAGTTFAGEREAAAEAIDRIRARLRDVQKSDPALEFRFTLNNAWSHKLFMALLRRYGITPYRYHGQRRTTVMARMPRSFVDETLWPEFQEINKVLQTYLDDITNRVIAQGIWSDNSDAEVRTGEANALSGPSME